MTKQLITARELAARLAVSPRTVRDWAAQGRIPVIRVSRRRNRFDWEEVLDALRQHGREEQEVRRGS